MIELLWRYIVGPIVADARGMETVVWNGVTATTGYNPVNTVLYAATAVTALFLLHRFLNNRDIQLTPATAVYSTPFILLGGTLRFLDDIQLVSYPFSIPLITPLVYLLIAAVYLPAVYKLEDKDVFKLGTAVLLPVLGYSLTGLNSANMIYAAAAISLPILLTGLYYFIVQEPYDSRPFVLLAFTQFFEGSASMLSTFYGYNPKHLLTQFFNNILGFPGVLVMKTLVLIFGLSVVTDLEDEVMKYIALMVLYSVGLGTGFRVFLRVFAGV